MSVVMGSGGMATASFTTVDAPRNSAVDVTSDELGAHSLDVAQSVFINSTSSLVTVTNRLGRDVTITVGLRDDSEHIGDLVVDGTVVGNATSFTLTQGTERTVQIEIPDDASLTDETVYFYVDASAPGLEVTAPDRSAPVNE
ncbi:hypothetical protein [Halorarum salinum]|uniref:Uncharacterized protein n=1 Tax=Halorarum salinum TaxID=2743089 RepID=A0A7D5LC34_9EURY|nr:hypothetical protein [Halobaculum salinum]QLG63212.1 hypothetical protein HUG12_16320 [Halobaculum salinum]